MAVWMKFPKGKTEAEMFPPHKDGSANNFKSLPPGEVPICCPETRRDPSVTKPVFPSGSFQCPPEENGCGAVWTKEGD